MRAPLVRALSLAACLGLVGQTGCDLTGKRKEVNAKKEEFLASYNPRAKTIRDELLAELCVCNENIEKLKRLRGGFKQESSRAFVNAKIEVLERQKEGIRSNLAAIDSEVEKGLALREFNQLDGGGVRDGEMRELLDKAQSEAVKSRGMNSELACSFGQQAPAEIGRQPGSAPPRRAVPPTRAPERSASEAASENLRTWSNNAGRSIRAALVSCDGQSVVLRRADGGLYTVSLATLSSESREYALSQAPTGDPASLIAPSTPAGAATYRVVQTQDGSVNLRQGPGLNHPVRSRLLGSTRGVEQTGPLIYNRNDDVYWMPVRFSGTTGYISAGFLQPE
jgi:hypothetical protein